ncbi:MAG: Hsp20/alpha crystallin family protein [Chloroflexi bacterium]|nr:Hsp20/alpha crystallin family protein [Chloroflexota bacterium]MCH7953391.1 Hsp20/alpha crystallin family protein [Chloroflexota bacterium]MCH8200514.1 Hsp20/alpha crystallin family protein [Chloroflexota bacterium]MCI0783515.1 Hsp20/alpha crystallin family protein [Chloroflexota bacterium]MCI0814074.1 Hsp20/alpha crystallin family protein [Chloroflexota bacterium]
MARQDVEMSDFEQHIQERMSRAYQRVFGSPANPGFGRPYMEPPVDIYHTDKEVVVLMEIAGIPEEEIELEVEGRSMVVRGRRKPLGGRPNRVYSQMEITHGAFQRDLLLPSEVNAEAAKAVYKDGILEITLPVTRPHSGRHLTIVVR